MFDEKNWESWSAQESTNYKIVKNKKKYLKKGYIHFDHRFWFPERKDELKQILKSELKVYKKSIDRIEYWSFEPFLKILIKTPRYRYQATESQYDLETKIRPICFASHMDSLIFGFYSYQLTKKYEEYIKQNNFDECVLAYRSDLHKSNIQFAKEVFDNVKYKNSCTAIALDITGYFDHIDHLTLKEKWSKIINGKLPEDQFRIYKALTQYSYVNRDSIYKTFKGKKKRNEDPYKTLLDLVPGIKSFEKFKSLRDKKLIVTNSKLDSKTKRHNGIPQGSAISALLSNIYLIDYDKWMYEKSQAEGFIYRRYCDDILIICETDKAKKLQETAINEIKEKYYLTIQNKKVEIIDFHLNSKNSYRAFKRQKNKSDSPVKTNGSNEKKYYKSLQYLGFEFNGQNIFIRSSSLSRYFRKMSGRIIKTLSMAYSPKSKSKKIFKKQLLEKYSHLGNRNFISYALNASKEFYKNSNGDLKEGMNSTSIKKQISRHFTILENNMNRKNNQFFLSKLNKNKIINKKGNN